MQVFFDARTYKMNIDDNNNNNNDNNNNNYNNNNNNTTTITTTTIGVMIFRFKKVPFPFGKIVNSVSKGFLNGNSVWP